ncbi:MULTISPECIES: S1 family peptidase [Streptomyces]|uniref:Putative serine protease n=3 Tax=Streptomyces scabiei TaxID=1930 RepID=C9ZGM2_STRSW|nr:MULTISPECIES: serine protease [Streptomyces]MBP5860278.1 serine protease [Streptomyces sp. LBUM 1484]MBP5870752.1 serine protease [Streptomyces sp. LBUM 1485]MBP5908712.1 serine protease [Streptomyces sp. LBUM 1478]MBP5927741.1 serine protease [Streptomyces sp. LBUM 1479]KFG09340.1 serine protease [Streptomyces scabiei]
MFGLNRVKKSMATATVTAAAAAAALLTAPGAAAAPQPIVGGTTTTASAYPFVMQITDAAQDQFCGGTLVSPTKVITAAHCMEGETTSSVRVVGGRTYANGTNGTVSRVSRIWVHPSFRDVKTGDDVAVLTLSTAMPYTTAKYVSSSNTGVYAAGTTARILGWGATASNGSSSNQLRTATVPLVSDSSCRTSYGSDFIASDMVCAGYTSGGVDTCQGDSGGPLLIGGVLAGITSWGEGCADAGFPGIYTRLTTFSSTVAAQIAS